MFTQEIYKPGRILGEDSNPWFWNPGRIGVELGPSWFRAKLAEIDEDLDVTWDRYNCLWNVWVRKPRLQTKLCQGWLLLFPVHDGHGNFVPLDERTLAKVYDVSARKWDSGKKYWDAVMRERAKDQENIDKWVAEDDKYKSWEYFGHTQIRTGYGPISASKTVGQ